jgi:hypothetical protein
MDADKGSTDNGAGLRSAPQVCSRVLYGGRGLWSDTVSLKPESTPMASADQDW